MSRPAISLLALLIASGLIAPAVASAACAPQRQKINDNNSLIMLGGTAKGAIKQFSMGEFGKNVNHQRRLLGEFDSCGALSRADLNYVRQEGGVTINMGQSILRVKSGWEEMYELSVVVERDGKQTEINHKQGTVSYMLGKDGNIISATDKFLLLNKPGSTETRYSYDRRRRLIKSVASGTDANSNGTTHYKWNAGNQLLAINSDSSKMSFFYDKQGREQRLTAATTNDISSSSSTDSCQLWDETGNCTLSYSHETEVFANGKINRDITAAYRFEYWDKAKKPAEGMP